MDPRILILDDSTASVDIADRVPHPAGALGADARPHDLRHRPAAAHDHARRRDRRARPRPGRAARQARGADRRRRASTGASTTSSSRTRKKRWAQRCSRRAPRSCARATASKSPAILTTTPMASASATRLGGATNDPLGRRRRRRLEHKHRWWRRWHAAPGRNADGWDDDYLGKVYDAEVVRRLLPYLPRVQVPGDPRAASAMVITLGHAVHPAAAHRPHRARGAAQRRRAWCLFYAGSHDRAGGRAVRDVGAAQQIITAWIGTRILRKLQSDMYDHVQSLSLSFYDEMEVGRIISRLTSDVTVMQDLLTTGSLTFAAERRRHHRHRRRAARGRLAARAGHLRDRPAAGLRHGRGGRSTRATPSCRRASRSARSTATSPRTSPASAPSSRCRARARTAAASTS